MQLNYLMSSRRLQLASHIATCALAAVRLITINDEGSPGRRGALSRCEQRTTFSVPALPLQDTMATRHPTGRTRGSTNPGSGMPTQLAVRAPRAQPHERVRYAVEAMSPLPNTPDELASLNREIETLNREAWNDRF
jgi:hypothetical protein